jgi:hypothetical protein
MSVRPKPLFQGNVDSNDSRVVDANDGNKLIAEDMMPTQALEALGEVDNLVPSIGLLDPEGYVDMRAPWVEGAKGKKVCHSGMVLGSSLMFCSVFTYRWRITRPRPRGLSATEARRRMAAVGVVGRSGISSRSSVRRARSAATAVFVSS